MGGISFRVWISPDEQRPPFCDKYYFAVFEGQARSDGQRYPNKKVNNFQDNPKIIPYFITKIDISLFDSL